MFGRLWLIHPAMGSARTALGGPGVGWATAQTYQEEHRRSGRDETRGRGHGGHVQLAGAARASNKEERTAQR